MGSTKVIGHILQVTCQSNSNLILDSRPRSGIIFDDMGYITACGEESALGDADIVYDYGDSFLIPGFIDTHVHFPQVDMIGAYSGELLEWLNNHAFPHEIDIIKDEVLAKKSAEVFSKCLYQNGTSTAVVFSSSHAAPCETLFEQFERSGGRIISGKTSMDRGAPNEILDAMENDLAQQERLIEKWHRKNDRIFYALTPRFAPSCTDPLMKGLAGLHSKFEGLYLQSHISENLDEVDLVQSIYPKAKHYLDVYDSFGLVHDRAIFAHGIHLSEEELTRIREAGTTIAHCPSSNLFLGSGLFPFKINRELGIKIALGTDVGAGTSFSIWCTMADAIKVSKMRRQQISPRLLFYTATLGAAASLGLGEKIGSLEVGKKADFQVFNPNKKELLSRRLKNCESEDQLLSALIFHADDRNLDVLWVDGKIIWKI